MATNVKKKYIWNKLKDEIGMPVPESNKTRVVEIITCMVHPYTCFQVTLHLTYQNYYALSSLTSSSSSGT